MKQRWRTLEAKFAKLARRERLIVFAGGIVVILLIGFSILDASLAKNRQLDKQLTQVNNELALSQAQVTELKRQLAQDPDAVARQRISELKAEIADIDARVRSVHRGLVPPDRMAAVLEDMLTQNRRVELVALKTLPVTTVSGNAPSEEDRSGVFRHGVEITLEGSYLALLDYLARLEKLPWQMFWAKAEMDASGYPRVRLTVVLYTLSLDRQWMVV